MKKGLSEKRAMLVAPQKARQMIAAGANRAVQQLGRVKPFRPKLPMKIRLRLSSKQQADAYERARRMTRPDWPAKRVDDTTFEATLENTKHIVL